MLYSNSLVIFLPMSFNHKTPSKNEERVVGGRDAFSSTQKPGKLLQMDPSLGGLIKQLTLQN